jgi:KDO2-lipid IV(A) lauroyltransferase
MLLYLISARRRRVASINLRLCFPELSEARRSRLVRQSFIAFGRSIVERGILWWGTRERIQKLIRVEGAEHFQNALGNPVILLTAHFVALDVGGSWITQHTDGVSVYSRQKNTYMQNLVLQKRARFGKQSLYARQAGMRPVIKSLREATLATLPRLVTMTNAKVVPCITRVLPNYKGYEVHFYPAWENYPTHDLIADTRRINEFIEQRVREMPEQYFWLHRRFKTRPEGEESFYK